jgi:hypothetical protein
MFFACQHRLTLVYEFVDEQKKSAIKFWGIKWFAGSKSLFSHLIEIFCEGKSHRTLEEEHKSAL